MLRERLVTLLVVSAITIGIVGITANDSESLDGFISFLTVFITTVAIFAVFALGLNVQWGYTGIFNFGIVGFFMVGAYSSALMTKAPSSSEFVKYVGGLDLADRLGPLNFEGLTGFVLGALAAAVISGIVAFLVAIPALRLREDYLAIATIGIAEVFRRIAIEEEGLVNGTRGLTGIPRPLHDLVSPPDYKYIYFGIAVVILVIIFVAIERAARSPWGRVLKAIREDELATAASGKNIFAFRMQAFVLGAMIMGIGGAVYAANQGSIVPDTFSHFFGTFIIWAMLMVGGSGSNRGAILGAYVVWGFWTLTGLIQPHLPAELEARTSYIRDLLIGLLIIVVLLLRPHGLMGEERRVSLFAESEDKRAAPRVGASATGSEE
jgi:branched-chain amino acid transport system permease protein